MNTIDLIRELNTNLEAINSRREEIVDLITSGTLSDEAFNKLEAERISLLSEMMEIDAFLDDLENNFESAVAFS